MSLLDFVLSEEEKIEEKLASYRRIAYHPFFKTSFEDGTVSSELPASSRSVNVNPQIYDYYLHSILPQCVPPGDDGDYAATALADVQCLKSLSRRIHLGKHVAEAKFRSDPERYTMLIKAGDREDIARELTHEDVEERIIQRVRSKARRYDKHPGITLLTPCTARRVKRA